jgi:hypothetical protein
MMIVIARRIGVAPIEGQGGQITSCRRPSLAFVPLALVPEQAIRIAGSDVDSRQDLQA